MTKTEMKNAENNEIIYRYIKAYSLFVCNMNLGGSTKSLDKELKNLDVEMLKRGLLTEDQVKKLNS